MKKILYLLLLLLVSCPVYLYGGEGEWTKRFALSNVVDGHTYSLADRSYSGADILDYSAYTGFVYLDYTRKTQSDLTIANDWRVTVEYGYTLSGVPQTGSLTISREGDRYIYTDYEKLPADADVPLGFSVTVTAITTEKYIGGSWVAETDLSGSSEFPSDIDLRLVLKSERVHRLDLSGLSDLIDLDFSSTDFRVSWNYLQGAEWYDLEWVFIDSKSKEHTEIIPMFSDNYFLNNGGYQFPFELKEPTRVRVWGTSYQLDKTFPTGTLYFRIRGGSNFVEGGVLTDQVKTGNWSYFYDASNPISVEPADIVKYEIDADAFETDKNWLYSANYAEDGKTVSSVAFLDGSNRGRQSLAYNTSDNITLVSEAKFDYEGRQVISVIPAPVQGRTLEYHPLFNRGLDELEFDENDFDGNYGVLSSSSGAARYFSNENDFTDDLFRDAIPYGGTFAYSQTVYRNDGTGRVERAGGVGYAHNVSESHAIETFYGTPTTFELKRLFGTNVADDPSGYRKDMVKDANGQLSVTYYDKRGNVIATGLAGESPLNLIALDDQEAVEVTSQLNPSVAVDFYTKISETTFMNTVPGNAVEINYSMAGIVNNLSGTVTSGKHTINLGDLCSTCEYHLTIEVKNAQGIHVAGSPFADFLGAAVACGEGGTEVEYSFPGLVTTFPDIGEYRIIKTLRVATSEMDEQFTQNLEDPVAEAEFISDYVEATDYSGCFNTCESYCEYLAADGYEQENGAGSWALADPGEKVLLINACLAESCNENEIYEDFETEEEEGETPEFTVCTSMLETMLRQISPGGFLYDNPLSTFWVSIGADETVEGVLRTTAYLQNPDNYTPAMALELLHHHREYCHLASCGEWQESIKYSTRLASVVASTAWSTGTVYDAPYDTDVSVSITEDPFLTSVFNPVSDPVANLAYRVENYLTLYPGIFSGTGSLEDYANAYVAYADAENTTANPLDPFTSGELEQTKKTIFKGLYGHLKETMVNEYKLSISCPYFLDDDAVFHRVMTQAEMEDQIAGGFSAMLNPVNCDGKAYTNAQLWIDQLPNECLEFLEGEGDYFSGFEAADLEGNLHAGSLEQLFYDYSIATCPANTWGWFYDPGTGNPGKTEYDALETLLGTCSDAWPVNFEAPAPGIVTTTFVNQQFSDCFDAFVEMLNEGIELVNTSGTACGSPLDCIKYTLDPTPSDMLTECGFTAATLVTVFDEGYTFEFNPGRVECVTELTLLYLDGTSVVPMPDQINQISNPRKQLIPGTPSQEVVLFDVMLLDGNIIQGYIPASSFKCIDLGDWTTQTITSVGSGAVVIPDDVAGCMEAEAGQSAIDAQIIYDGMMQELMNRYKQSHCLTDIEESFTLTYTLKEYQYTLYYYDLAGNLVQTVPPQGVDLLTPAEVATAAVQEHRMETRYAYNGLNTMTSQYTPDAGEALFFLDKLYRVRFSQNARQEAEDKASYTKYDDLGRTIEAGELLAEPEIGQTVVNFLRTKVEDNAYPVDEMLDYTVSYYEQGYEDDPSIAALFENGEQENLRNSIGAVWHRQGDYDGSGELIAGTEVITVLSYSYDVHKNVNEMASTNYQLAPLGQQHKKVEYDYDLLSGNVNEVAYQKGVADEYRHRYHYDANNRLVRAFTSNNGERWEKDAKYFYYLHGSLARTEIGHDQVQGTDYAYTINGWLKGVNSATLKSSRDLGKDGGAGLNESFGADAHGFQLGYHNGDYESIGEVKAFANTDGLTAYNSDYSSLWNGNISHMVTAIRKTDESVLDILGNNYTYDQLQRIKSVDAYFSPFARMNNDFDDAALYQETGGDGVGAYQERYSFDKNGNLTHLTRNGSGRDHTGTGSTAFLMDDFTYHYYENLLAINATALEPIHTNRLGRVEDVTTGTGSYTSDINAGQTGDNYVYDATGQLIEDKQEGIENIEWTVTGKVKRITFASGSDKHGLRFIYDPMDRRIAKMQYLNGEHTELKVTYYSYDASGNPMATYTRNTVLNGEEAYFDDALELTENNIYGSSRIGVDNRNMLLSSAKIVWPSYVEDVNLDNTVPYTWINLEDEIHDKTFREVGNKSYEMSNHLGNVLSVVTDRKIAPVIQGAEITDQVGISVETDGTITRTAGGSGWNASGGASVEAVENGGYIEWTSVNHDIAVGLSYDNPDAGYATIDYCLYSEVTAWTIYQNAVFAPGSFYGSYGAYVSGDLMRIQRKDGMILFFKNGVLIESLTDSSPTLPMVADFALYSTGTHIQGLRVVNPGYYVPDVVSYSDYSPYGVQLDQRHGQDEQYRYGYQGSEKDDEIKGEGNSYTTEYRMLDPRIGRWLSIDPLAAKYPGMSPYVSMNNNPVTTNDVTGTEGTDWVKKPGVNGGRWHWSDDYNDPETARNDGYDFIRRGSIISGRIGDGPKATMWAGYGANDLKYLHDGEPANKNDTYGWLANMSLENHFGDNPSIGSEGKGAFYDDLSSPFHKSWEHRRANVDAAGKFVLAYGAAGLATPFVAGSAILYAPIVYSGVSSAYSSLPLTTTALNSTTGMLGTSSIFGSMVIVGEGYMSTSLTKTGIDLGLQGLANGWGNIDYFDGAASGFLTSGYSAVLRGGIDVNSDKMQMVGFGKPASEAFIDGTLKYAFSSAGPAGKITNKLTSTLYPATTPSQNAIQQLWLSPFTYGSKITQRNIKNELK